MAAMVVFTYEEDILGAVYMAALVVITYEEVIFGSVYMAALVVITNEEVIFGAVYMAAILLVVFFYERKIFGVVDMAAREQLIFKRISLGVVCMTARKQFKPGTYRLGVVVKMQTDPDGLVRTVWVEHSLLADLPFSMRLAYKGVTKEPVEQRDQEHENVQAVSTLLASDGLQGAAHSRDNYAVVWDSVQNKFVHFSAQPVAEFIEVTQLLALSVAVDPVGVPAGDVVGVTQGVALSEVVDPVGDVDGVTQGVALSGALDTAVIPAVEVSTTNSDDVKEKDEDIK